jgi:ribosome-binding factor A
MKNRLVRVRELLKRELGSIVLRDLRFDSPLVSISGVDITPDLKNAHVFVSALGSDGQRRDAIKTLEHSRVALQNELSRRVVLKNTPYLHFWLDDSIERGTRVIHLMNELGLEELPPEAFEEENDDER